MFLEQSVFTTSRMHCTQMTVVYKILYQFTDGAQFTLAGQSHFSVSPASITAVAKQSV
jgi:hypothetical protein